MFVLSQCASNIEKIETRASASKSKYLNSSCSSPLKQQTPKTAAICLVNLTKNENAENSIHVPLERVAEEAENAVT